MTAVILCMALDVLCFFLLPGKLLLVWSSLLSWCILLAATSKWKAVRD